MLVDTHEGATAAPYERDLAPSERFALSSVSARFDGSGAAGSFKPCLSFYAQSGELLARTFPDQTMAPGDVSEVTFAPF